MIVGSAQALAGTIPANWATDMQPGLELPSDAVMRD
jgi:hypothetical protein